MAIKAPFRISITSPAEYEQHQQGAEEKRVYERLVGCAGVVQYLGGTFGTLQLELMLNGDLQAYLARHQAPRAQQCAWIRQMAMALAGIHRQRVVVQDVASRNFLLDAQLGVHICDFSNALLLPLDAAMDEVENLGFSVQTDLGELGAVIYEVVTGRRVHFDLFLDDDTADATWPRRDSLPPTEGIWLGGIIERCWTKQGIRNADALAAAIVAAAAWVLRWRREFVDLLFSTSMVRYH
ncbi:hypothetical protein LOZ58_005365 [Ophidiomyces ophidiicola]|nr:hypothetical protein LOZ58_005365 [Ophidiomyces ophidiicola]